MTLREKVPVVYDDTMAVDQRFIYIQMEDSNYEKHCVLHLDIHPLSLLPSFNVYPEEGSICQTIYRISNYKFTKYLVCPLLNKRRTYFVVYGRFYYSWMDVKHTCTLLGATMPYIISKWDNDLLTKLLLRSSQLSAKKFTHAHCRHFDSICGTFIGLTGNNVSEKCEV